MGINALEVNLEEGYGPYPLELVRGSIPVYFGNSVPFHAVIRFHQAVRSGLLPASATFPDHIPVEQYLVPDLDRIDSICHIGAELEFLELQRMVLDAFKTQFLAAKRSKSYRKLRELFDEIDGSPFDENAALMNIIEQSFISELSEAGDYAVFLEQVRISIQQGGALDEQSLPNSPSINTRDAHLQRYDAEIDDASASYLQELEKILGVNLGSTAPEIAQPVIAQPRVESNRSAFKLNPKRSAKVVSSHLPNANGQIRLVRH